MTLPRTIAILQQLDDDPRYRGSIHDAEIARARGFPGALVPGAFLYGHISRVAVQEWGADWIARGAMGVKFRRPVYDGDRLLLSAAAVDGGTGRAAVEIERDGGEVVATGWIAPPEDRPPPVASLDRQSINADGVPERLAVDAGGMHVGMTFASVPRPLLAGEIEASARAFAETETLYDELGVAHSGCLMRIVMSDSYTPFRFPAAVILAGVEAWHFMPVRKGAMIETRGRVVAAEERAGRYSFTAEECLLADGAMAARFLRRTVYA
ncbi:MAG: MaoC family dehydratase [Geminicoccaceae bacterium]|nr:MaoC family dehydratase [Geminicoccaceae bacterium]